MTVHRWKRDSEVLRRADWLAKGNKQAGDLLAKANWRARISLSDAIKATENIEITPTWLKRLEASNQHADGEPPELGTDDNLGESTA